MRVKAGLPKAADIPDIDMLALVHRLGLDTIRRRGWTEDQWPYAWVHWFDLCEQMASMPPKVIKAKMSALKRRGLVDGCDCGCRGDWHLTQPGRDLLGIVIH